MILKRNIEETIRSALKDTPVVFLSGARQSGKSTLVTSLISGGYKAEYVTFDEITALSGAKADPGGFLKNFRSPLVIDEIQRVPELFPAIKAEVDSSRKPGRFILTGSANILLLPKLAEFLVGRMEMLMLWPFSQGELNGVKETTVDRLFSEDFPRPTPPALNRSSLMKRVLRGGYPEVLTRETEERRRSWFDSYITTILDREVRDLSHIDGLMVMPRLLSLLAARAGSLLNYTELSSSTSIPQTTLKRYLALLEAAFLIKVIPPWSSNIGKRLINTPKVFLSDTGLLAHLIGWTADTPGPQDSFIGPLLENFVLMEIIKQVSWSRTVPGVFHFRTSGGQEVDLLLENRRGEIVGIKVKSAGTVTESHFRALKILAEATGKKFRRGIILYTGHESVPFGKNLMAIPLNSLWG